MTLATVEFASETVRRETLAHDVVERFYEGLNEMFSGDLSIMDDTWTHTSDAALLSPYGGRAMGWTDIRRLFERDAELKHGGHVWPRDLMVRWGRELAYSVGIERGKVVTSTDRTIEADIRATNLLRLEDGVWRVFYHHTDPLLEMQEASGWKWDDFGSIRGDRADTGILKALDRYYEAIRAMFDGDLMPMERLWAKTDDVTLAAPTGNIQVGWYAVRTELERHTNQDVRGRFETKDPWVRIYDDMALASYRVWGPDLTINGKPYPFDLRATTLFRHDGGEWRIVHHHTDYAKRLSDLCGGMTK